MTSLALALLPSPCAPRSLAFGSPEAIASIHGMGSWDYIKLAGTWDLDGDGTRDIVLYGGNGAAGTSNGSVRILKRRTTWPQAWSLASTPADITVGNGLPDTNSYLIPITVADVDGDGLGDLILREFGTMAAYVIRGRAAWPAVVDPSTDPLTMKVELPSAELVTDLDVGDVDGDGLADLVFGSEGRSTGLNALRIMRGRNGLPASMALDDADVLITGFDSRWGSVAVGDVNGDGIADIASSGPAAFLMFGRTSWPAAIALGLVPPDRYIVGSGNGGVQIGALHGSGTAELMEYNADFHNGLRVWPGGPDVGLAGPEIEVLPADNDVVVGTGGDVDGDGVLDLIASALGAEGPRNLNGSSGEVHVFRGPLLPGIIDLASRRGDAVVYGTTGEGIDAAFAADVAGDGSPELIVGAHRVSGGPDPAPGQGGVRIFGAPDFAADAPIPDRYVDATSGAAGADALSWATAERSIAPVLAQLASVPGRAIVHVAPGTYAGPLDVGAGFTLLGGSNPATGRRNPFEEPSVLVAPPDGPALWLRAGRGGEASRVDGFVITGGTARAGAAVKALLPDAILSNCIIRGNQSPGFHEALRRDCWTADRTVWWSGFICCARPGLGSAVRVEPGGAITLINVLIEGNSATALPTGPCDPPEPPAGMFCDDVICDPGDFPFPATVAIDRYGRATLRNVTITGNEGEGVRAHSLGGATIEDSILFGQAPSDLGGPAGILVTRSIVGITTVPLGAGASNDDPLFVDAAARDFRLSAIASGQPNDSPALDAGSTPAAAACMPVVPDMCLDELTTRTDGALDSGLVDLGFHRFPNDPPLFAGARSAAAAGECAIVIEWDAAIDVDGPGTTAFRVHRGPPGAVDLSTAIAVLPESARSYRDGGLAWNATWSYVVRAEDAPGHHDGNSTEVTATTADVAAPAAGLLTAEPGATCDVLLDFTATDACSGVAGYELHRSNTPGFVPGPATLVAAPLSFPHVDTTAANGNFYYVVLVRDLGGNVAASRHASARVASCGGPLPVPGEARILTMLWRAPTVSFVIEPAPGADFHRSFRGALADLRSGYGHAAGGLPNCRHDTTAFEDMDVATPGNFYYVIVGVNAAGEGVYGTDSFGRAIPDAAALGTVTCP